jgi:hypothetical protein
MLTEPPGATTDFEIVSKTAQARLLSIFLKPHFDRF